MTFLRPCLGWIRSGTMKIGVFTLWKAYTAVGYRSPSAMESGLCNPFPVRTRMKFPDTMINNMGPEPASNMVGIKRTMISERKVMVVGEENIHIQDKKARKYKTIPPETSRHGSPDIILINGRRRPWTPRRGSTSRTWSAR